MYIWIIDICVIHILFGYYLYLKSIFRTLSSLKIEHQSNNRSFIEGQEFQLFCISNLNNNDMNWRTCKWKKYGLGEHEGTSNDDIEWCFRYDSRRNTCDNKFLNHARLDYGRRKKECRLHIKSAALHDHGNWECTLEAPTGETATSTKIFITVRNYVLFFHFFVPISQMH